jgi:hypothetical protein
LVAFAVTGARAIYYSVSHVNRTNAGECKVSSCLKYF